MPLLAPIPHLPPLPPSTGATVAATAVGEGNGPFQQLIADNDMSNLEANVSRAGTFVAAAKVDLVSPRVTRPVSPASTSKASPLTVAQNGEIVDNGDTERSVDASRSTGCRVCIVRLTDRQG